MGYAGFKTTGPDCLCVQSSSGFGCCCTGRFPRPDTLHGLLTWNDGACLPATATFSKITDSLGDLAIRDCASTFEYSGAFSPALSCSDPSFVTTFGGYLLSGVDLLCGRQYYFTFIGEFYVDGNLAFVSDNTPPPVDGFSYPGTLAHFQILSCDPLHILVCFRQGGGLASPCLWTLELTE